MLGIALRYGVTLEALQAANPSIDPQFLSVDTTLIIPLGDEITFVASTPTPLPVKWSEPVCYRSGDDGAWCFVLVENHLDSALENLSAWIGLFGNDNEIVASQVAVGPMNILRPGQAMPLLAYFQSPLPLDITARAELLTAIAIPGDDGRYLDWPLTALNVEIMGDELREAEGGLALRVEFAAARHGIGAEEIEFGPAAFDKKGADPAGRAGPRGGSLGSGIKRKKHFLGAEA